MYPDGTTGGDKRDDVVAPGESYTYTWQVKPEYAPTEADAPCLTWIYHSHVDSPKDIASGLIGPLLICKQGKVHTQGVIICTCGIHLVYTDTEDFTVNYLASSTPPF